MDPQELLEKIDRAARSRAKTLNLSFNRLMTLPPEVFHLTNLTGLDLSFNQLTTLPPEIVQLSNLRTLNLSSNRLTALPPEIVRLSNLSVLDLSFNRLTTLPPEIVRLTNLTVLDLSRNQLAALPPEIVQLSELIALDLSFNQLTDLPPKIARLTKLVGIDLKGNPLAIPPEIVAQGTRAVFDYLAALLKAGSRQWISKMLVVGQGGVGKTSLLRALKGEPFRAQQETTHGIEIGTLGMQHPTEPDVTMRLNAWDFAGQEIQHATHQFFLTNRSLFLVAWNARHGFEQGKLYYWLNTIKALAPESPVLLVATWTDERDPDLPLTDLRRAYPQIVGHCAISNKTGAGVEALRRAITEAAADPKKLPLMGERWPTNWLNAANAVRAMPEKHLPHREFERRLAEHEVDGEDARVLTQWMHELGDILHFRDNEELNDTVILKPQWVTQYIAKVLESEEVIRQQGLFSRDEMERLWGDLDPTMQERFLRLMEQFDLSYRTLENREISLVVERLPLDEADYHARWNAIQSADPCHEIAMKFELSSIPAGIPTWFIARQHRFTTHTHWRNGVLFADDPAETHLALARAFPHDRHLRLIVRGPHPQDFFALLKDGIEVTLRRFPGLDITRKIPCRCRENCPHEFDHQDLLNRIHRKPTIECPKSGIDVPVAELLYGIEWSEQDIVLDKLEQLSAAESERHEEVIRRFEDQAALLQREFLKLFEREQRFVESHCPNVFVLRQKKTGALQKLIVGQRIELQLLCHYPGDWHPLGERGIYEIDDPAEWLRKIAPHVRRMVQALKLAAPFASPLLGVYLSEDEAKAFETNLKLTEELIKNLPDIQTEHPEPDRARRLGLAEERRRVEGADLRALRQLLDRKDPQQHWGGLKKVLTPEGHYLWLCKRHAAEFKR